MKIKFLKNYRNVNVKSSASIVTRIALSKLITLLISNKKEFNHFFKSKSSDIVLLKLGNLNQNAKCYEVRHTEREARRPLGRAPQARLLLRAKRAARDENVRAKRADFFTEKQVKNL